MSTPGKKPPAPSLKQRLLHNPAYQLQNLLEWLADEIVGMSDEEIYQLYIDAGLDPEVEANKVRDIINKALARHHDKNKTR